MSQEAVDWNKLTLPKLKEELKRRSLPQTGVKADLVSRLQEDDEAQAAAGGDADAEEAPAEEAPAEDDGTYENEGAGEGQEEVTEVLEGEGDEAQEGLEAEAGQEEGNGEGEEHTEEQAEEVGEGDTEENKEGEEKSAENEDEKKKKEEETEELYKQIEKDFFIDIPRESDTCILTWHGKKFTIPFASEVHRDLAAEMKGTGFCVHPVELSEVQSDLFQRLIDKSIKFSIDFLGRSAGKTNIGSVKLIFNTADEATNAQEELKAYKESLSFEDLKFEYKESEEGIIPAPVKLPPSSTRPIVHRLLYVGSLPNDVTEPSLKELFPDALRVIIPRKGNEEKSENEAQNRYAYIEYETEDAASTAAEEHKEAIFNDEKLFVIPAISVRKERFGLLSNTLRSILIDKTRKLKRIVKNPYNKSSFELKEIEKTINQNMEKINKDAEHREKWGIPLGRLETSKVDEEDTPSSFNSQRGGGRGGFRGSRGGRGGPRGGSTQMGGRGGGQMWSPTQRGGGSYGGYGSGNYGGGGYRRGGGGSNYGGGYNQGFGGAAGYGQQQFNTYNSFGGGGLGSGGFGGVKRRADDNPSGGDWKRARGGRGGRGFF